ncbi:MAG TPA: IS481 family transposase [Actinomycetota bacterium]
MDLARYVVDAVVLEGRSYREVARAHGVSKSWVSKLVGRYRAGGYEAIVPRSRAAKRIPHRTCPELEDEIVALRKELTELGVDAGAATIAYHLGRRHDHVPSISTIWRVLRRRGFVMPQPHKRPRSSWIRFEATLPNECWQSDVTHWRLGDGTEVDIVNFLDDHSRLAIASRVLRVATAPTVLEVFREAGERWGFPAALLTDNGCVYTTWHRGGPNVMQTELLAAGIDYRHSRPYHPQTCGKVERFHQTLKRWLARQRPARSIDELQGQIDRFVAYYNEVRPHRAAGRRPPRAAFDARDKARPSGPKIRVGAGVRVRRDRIDKGGKVTLRHGTRLHHIGVGHAHKGKRVILLVDGLDVRVVSLDGELLRHLTLDPSRNYQPQAS